MNSNVFNTENHNDGGRDEPYEKFHLSQSERQGTLKGATYANDGIMPAGILRDLIWTDPVPTTSNYPGKKGQKARDDNYLYICIRDNYWKRVDGENTF